MREHPIPQDITNYRFHIIGSMTLRQFAEIFLGVIIALLIYSTNLPDIIKWALIAISVGLGAAAAFVPIEERPLDHWIATFFKVLYKPTRFFWRREPHLPEPFNYTPRANQQKLEPELDLTPAKRARIKEYLTSVNTPSEYQSDLTQWEAGRMQQITEIFSTIPVVSSAKPAKKTSPAAKPSINVRVRNLRSDAFPVARETEEVTIYTNAAAPQPPQDDAGEKAELTQFPDRNVSIPKIPVAEAQVQQVQEAQQEPEPDIAAANPPTAVSGFSYIQNQAPAPSTIEQQASEAAFNRDLPFPEPPNEPNKIVGMVLTPNNELVTNAIVEIQTENGQIVRAVKSNALGQFFITTPLNNGVYVVAVEKEGYSFVPQKVTLSGEQVAPLEVRSS